jgi:predicted dehydrogenase
MANRVKWGVIGVAGIAVNRVIPGMQKCERSEIVAIASRDLDKAKGAAAKLGIPKAYGTYEALLADPEVEVIYNPLPNHLHVSWSIKAAEAGKHVLCEKPIGMNAAEARTLIAARDRTGVRMGEAFMVHSHPQWLRAREIVRSGELGELRAMVCMFSYFQRDPKNVRNIVDIGGGCLMDIGCYPISLSRFVSGQEPTRAVGALDRDPDMKVDRLTSAIVEFPWGQLAFTCSSQMVPFQQMQIFGTKARVEVEIPVNAAPERPARIFVDNGANLYGGGRKAEEFPICNQYALQADNFSRAVREGGDVPTPLENAMGNMKVIDAIFKSGETGTWINL